MGLFGQAVTTGGLLEGDRARPTVPSVEKHQGFLLSNSIPDSAKVLPDRGGEHRSEKLALL
jgi:hypothetical protein